ncbi:MAG: hypothetical protein ACHQRM_10200 [Bacteroidia bacterium]
MLYITFNDAPSGIYFSQVTAVCEYMEVELNTKMRLIAFISLRSFGKNRRAIRSEYKQATVVPMFPTMLTWRWNSITLALLLLFGSRKACISRGPYATWLALCLKKAGLISTVCFDARGAYKAELNEYTVVTSPILKEGIAHLEADVLHRSDFRIAVSESLVTYWEREFDYRLDKHVVIPCTLHKRFLDPISPEDQLNVLRKNMHIEKEDILIAYSGSNAGWQSFSAVKTFLAVQLKNNSRLKIVFMSKEIPEGLEEDEVFRSRFIRKWVEPAEVRSLLCICDYGLIIREASVTNLVSSPVKFAEYLACGLHVLISEAIGDYPAFVEQHQCGQVVHDLNTPLQLCKGTYTGKEKLHDLATRNFSKNTFRESYKRLIA